MTKYSGLKLLLFLFFTYFLNVLVYNNFKLITQLSSRRKTIIIITKVRETNQSDAVLFHFRHDNLEFEIIVFFCFI